MREKEGRPLSARVQGGAGHYTEDPSPVAEAADERDGGEGAV
jgi:hypothetical protein